jgi:uncharacterized protein involved in exopolysaccharide biosynthesis
VLRVMPPAASASVIPDVFNVRMADRIASMQQSILSRSTLSTLIDTFKLYPGERSRLPMEDVIERMRRDIVVSPVTASATGGRGSYVFRISFSYQNRFDAQRVTQNLVSRFLDENASERGRVLDSVNGFLREEYDRAQAELQAAEERLANFRRSGGASPDSSGFQLHQLSLLDARFSGANAGLARARQELALIEAEQRAARQRLRRSADAAVPPSTPAAAPVRHPLEFELERLLARYKPTHPDVVRVQQELDAQRLKIQPVTPAPDRAPATQPDAELEERVLRAEGQARAKSLEIARLEKEAGEIAQANVKLQRSLATSPDRTLQSEELVREHELALQRHREAKRKLLEGEGALKGNRWNLAENLELVDAPALPETPVAPNRAAIAAASAALGLFLGILLAWLRETNDEAIRTVRQLHRLITSRILGGIPLLESDLIVRRRRRAAVLAWASASLLSLAAIASAVVYHHYR